MENKFGLPVGNEIHIRRYLSFIERCLSRKLFNVSYTERHHILPKSLGGSELDSNMIVLSLREHYIAHLILWMCGYDKMRTAFWQMTHTRKNIPALSSKQYERLKNEFIEWSNISKKNKFWITNSKQEKLIEKGNGIPEGWNKGRLLRSKESNFKTSESLKRLWAIPAMHEKLKLMGEKTSKRLMGHKHSDSTKIKLSKARTEYYSNTANRIKMSDNVTHSICIHNGIIEKRVKTIDEIPEGWMKGRLKTVYINNGIMNKRISKKELISEGWKLGKIGAKKLRKERDYSKVYNLKRAIKVKCIETGFIFNSLNEASEKTYGTVYYAKYIRDSLKTGSLYKDFSWDLAIDTPNTVML